MYKTEKGSRRNPEDYTHRTIWTDIGSTETPRHQRTGVWPIRGTDIEVGTTNKKKNLDDNSGTSLKK